MRKVVHGSKLWTHLMTSSSRQFYNRSRCILHSRGRKSSQRRWRVSPPAPAVSFFLMDQYICQVLPERGLFHVCPVAAAGCDMKKLMFCQSLERKKLSMGLHILNERVSAEGYIFRKYTCSFDLKGESWIIGFWFSFLFVKWWTSQRTFPLCMYSFQLSPAVRSCKAKSTLLILNGALLLRF